MNILQWILEHKWAITSTALQTIIEIVSKETDLSTDTIAKAMHGSIWERYVKDGDVVNFNSLEGSNYPLLDGARMTSVADCVAIIPVIGPIFPRANLMSMSGGSSLQSLAYDFNVALDSSQITAIIMNIDSPGGEITGVNEFVDMIYAANTKKPIISYIYGLGASAGYWMASGGSEIVLAPTAEVGSLGVVAGYTDRSTEKEKKGIKDFEIISSQSPFKRADPSTTGGRAQIQGIVDQLADVFISSVARNRGITRDEVLANYGQGMMFVGQDAVDRGLADRIGSLEMLIEEQKAQKPEFHSNPFFGGVMDLKTLRVENPELFAEIKALGKSEAEAELAPKVAEDKIAAARKEGAQEENERIQAVEKITVPGSSEVIAAHKFDMTKGAGEISTLVLQAQQEGLSKMQDGLKKDGEDLANLSKGLGTEEAETGEKVDEALVGAMVAGMDGFGAKR